MVFIRDSALFTTLLHCVLACSLPSDDLDYTPGPCNTVSPIPDTGILESPYYNDKTPQTEISQTPTFAEIPYRVNKYSTSEQAAELKLYNPQLPDDVKNRKPLFNTEQPAILQRLKYPSTKPRVKINFVGASGILPITTKKPEPYNVLSGLSYVRENNIQHTSTYKPDSEVKINFNYSSTPPGIYPSHVPEVKQTSPYIPYLEVLKQQGTSEKGLPEVQNYYPYLPNADHSQTEPFVKELVLPPVPTDMPTLRRRQVALMNTVAGLPGGVTQILDSVRAR